MGVKSLLSLSSAGWRAKVSPVSYSGACTPRARVGVALSNILFGIEVIDGPNSILIKF